MFRDFDCKIGDNLETASTIHVSEINKKIDELTNEKKEAFYLEVLAKPGHRTNKKK